MPFMPSRAHLVVGLGEILWDLLPGGKQLGGAPANFAHGAALLGNHSTVASRIGLDSLGDDILHALDHAALSGNDLQRDPSHSTGTVHVRVDSSGQASYEIVDSVAWDFLEFTPTWQELAQRTAAVCFGTLAQRSPQSRTAIRGFLEAARPNSARVFDVNLRQKFYSAEIIDQSLQLCNIVKLNDQELPTVARLLNMNCSSEGTAAEEICHRYELDLVCVTKGDEGSLLVNTTGSDMHPGFKVKVSDTIGAGDAFTAGMVHQYLKHASLREMNDLANRMGAWVSTQPGAMPRPRDSIMATLEAIGARDLTA
jgi:fructokinase